MPTFPENYAHAIRYKEGVGYQLIPFDSYDECLRSWRERGESGIILKVLPLEEGHEVIVRKRKPEKAASEK